jgi:tetratricopeptide (TPR) repeat protein
MSSERCARAASAALLGCALIVQAGHARADGAVPSTRLPSGVEAPASAAGESTQTELQLAPAAPQHEPEAEPESAALREARERTARARERFEAGDYTAALLEFTRAYELMAAGDPRRAALLNNIAVCHERLFRYDLALATYQRYLDEGNPSAEDRAEVEAVIGALRELLGKLHVTSNIPAEVWIDGRALGHAPGDFQVPSGARVIELRASGYQASRLTLQITARELRAAHFELEPLPTYRGIDRRYFWSGVALTGVFLVTGGGLGLRALNLYHDAQDKDEAMLLKPGDQDKMQNMALAADVAFGAAAVFAVSSMVLAFMTDFRGSGDKRAPTQAPQALRLRVRPAASTSALGLTLTGALR